MKLVKMLAVAICAGAFFVAGCGDDSKSKELEEAQAQLDEGMKKLKEAGDAAEKAGAAADEALKGLNNLGL